MFLIKAFRSANDVMTSSYAPKWSPLQMLFFQINLLSNLNIIRLVLGDWSCSGNIKQDFLTIFPICCFTRKAVNKWAYISETPPNQPDYPWFSKCTLNFGLGEHMLINSTDMWHLPPFSHWSITTFLVKEDHIWPFICYLKKKCFNKHLFLYMPEKSYFSEKKFKHIWKSKFSFLAIKSRLTSKTVSSLQSFMRSNFVTCWENIYWWVQ